MDDVDDFHDFDDAEEEEQQDQASAIGKASGAAALAEEGGAALQKFQKFEDDLTDDEEYELEPSLQNLLEQDTLKWIFVGGKGGVGKTTTSCSIGTKIARERPNRKVLIVSTDPAHNVSDAFAQKFGKDPLQVEGVDNLYCMEIEPKIDPASLAAQAQAAGGEVAAATAGLTGETGDEDMSGAASGMMKVMQELTAAIPGIDEAMSFAELMKMVQSMEYDHVVFDTAPTGHTLRLLSFPTVLDSAIGKVLGLKDQFGGMINGVSAMMGGGMGSMITQQIDSVVGKLESTRAVIQQVNTMFKDPDSTTFVCVAIPEFLSLYETERLVQELSKFEIDTHCIVVNQVLIPREWTYSEIEKPSWADNTCNARLKMQRKYLNQFDEWVLHADVVAPPPFYTIRSCQSIWTQLIVHLPTNKCTAKASTKTSTLLRCRCSRSRYAACSCWTRLGLCSLSQEPRRRTQQQERQRRMQRMRRQCTSFEIPKHF